MNQGGRLFHSACYLVFCFFAVATLAEETITRSYLLPDQFKVPLSWIDDLRQPPHRLPPD